MHPELQALLRLQDADDVVDDLAARLDAIAPRLAALDAERATVGRRLEQAVAQVEAAEHKQRDLAQLVASHRERHERNMAQLDLVKRMREATAAMSQVEAGKRMLAEGEQDLRALGESVAAMRQAVAAHREALEAFDATQGERRDAILAERGELETTLAAARARRDAEAAQVGPAQRTPYERMRSRRRARVLFPVNGGACGSCDTAIPVQRRAQMLSRGTIEPCEECGMLLYAAE